MDYHTFNTIIILILVFFQIYLIVIIVNITIDERICVNEIYTE